MLTSGQLMPAMDFLARHPQALLSVFSLSLSATVGARPNTSMPPFKAQSLPLVCSVMS